VPIACAPELVQLVASASRPHDSLAAIGPIPDAGDSDASTHDAIDKAVADLALMIELALMSRNQEPSAKAAKAPRVVKVDLKA
jgi:hypothetical protein